MLSPRLDPRALLTLLRGLSAGRLCAAVFVGLLVLPQQPASDLLTFGVFAPIGIALWYLAFERLETLVRAVTVEPVRRYAHVTVGLGVVWTTALLHPLQWLFAWAAVAAVVYAAAGVLSRRRVRARVL